MLGQQIDGGLEGLGVLDQAGDVTKQDPGLGIVGDGLDAGFDKFQNVRIHVMTAYFLTRHRPMGQAPGKQKGPSCKNDRPTP